MAEKAKKKENKLQLWGLAFDDIQPPLSLSHWPFFGRSAFFYTKMQYYKKSFCLKKTKLVQNSVCYIKVTLNYFTLR